MKTAHIYRRVRVWLAHRSRNELRFWGAFSGFVLAQGAPVGLLIHTYLAQKGSAGFWQHTDESVLQFSAFYYYVWVGTTVYFTAFGFTISALMSSYWQEYRRSRSAMILFAQFEQMRAYFRRDIQQKLKSPAAAIEEFIQGINEGLFGKFSDDQRQVLQGFLGDLLRSHKSAGESLAPKHTEASLRDLVIEHKLSLNISHLSSGENVLLDLPVAVDPNLFRNAFHEIFLELQKVGRPTLRFSFGPSGDQPFQNWPHDQFLTFALVTAKPLKNVPKEWSIVRHIFEWYGGAFWTANENNSDRFYFAIPRAAQTKKTEAA